MARLIESDLLPDLPLTIGDLTLTAVSRGPETLVMPFRGRETASALRSIGLGYPKPNTFETSDSGAIIWAGHGKALLIGVAAPEKLADGAALVDQTGAQAVILLSGATLEEVLARLVPIDLRIAAFPVGAVVLSLLGHMTAALRRTGAGIEVAVVRSMAYTLIDDLTEAASHVAARAAPD